MQGRDDCFVSGGKGKSRSRFIFAVVIVLAVVLAGMVILFTAGNSTTGYVSGRFSGVSPGGDAYTMGTPEVEFGAPPAMNDDVVFDAFAGAKSKGVSETDAVDVTEDRKVVYSGDVRVETMLFQEVYERVRRAVETSGGYFESDSVSSRQGGSAAIRCRSAAMVIRVPAGRFRNLIETIESENDVAIVMRDIHATDVSENYYDTEARLATERIKIGRYNDLMKDATDVSDVMAIEAEIASAQSEADRLQGIINGYDSRIKYSTLNLRIDEVPVAAVRSDDMTFVEQLSAGLSDGYARGVAFLRDLSLAIVANWMVLLCWLIVAIVVLFVFRAVCRRIRDVAVSYRSQQVNPNPVASGISHRQSMFAPSVRRTEVREEKTSADLNDKPSRAKFRYRSDELAGKTEEDASKHYPADELVKTDVASGSAKSNADDNKE